MPVPLPPDEPERLNELGSYHILDTPPEGEYDDLVYLASQICGTPTALMSLIDAQRQWLKSRIGFDRAETPRDQAFCSHAILKHDLMVVEDAAADVRFADNPLVTADPKIRFYAGAPLVTPQGHAMGTLCVIDQVPRHLTSSQFEALQALSRQIVKLLQLREAKEAAESANRTKTELLETLRVEQAKSDRLLASLFPPAIAERLRDGCVSCIADEYSAVTILFADIHDFWRVCGSCEPGRMIELLNRVFSMFDGLAEAHGVQKMKTIGDAYMAVAGLPVPRKDHARAVAEMALSMQREIPSLETGTEQPFSVRIGINSGPVVAGVVGTIKLAYDMWGPTVNLANQMETSSFPGGIQVTQSTYNLLKDDYLFEPRGEFYVKGQGEVATYMLTGRRRRP